MGGMSDEPKKRTWARWVPAALLALPLLYVASIGPVVWLESRGYVRRNATRVYFLPVTFALRAAPVLERPYISYVRLWMPNNGVWGR